MNNFISLKWVLLIIVVACVCVVGINVSNGDSVGFAAGHRNTCSNTDANVLHPELLLGSVNGYDNNRIYSISDRCKNNKTLIEYDCRNNNYVTKTYNCVNGCANGKCNANVCIPKNCTQLNRSCGIWDNGCQGTVSCSTCGTGKICNSTGRCVNTTTFCTPGTPQAICNYCSSDGSHYIQNQSKCSSTQTCNSTGQCIGANQGKFSINDHVRVVLTTDCLNVRPSPTINSTPIKCEPNGTSGITAIITGNYVKDGSYTFWPLTYSDGISGWSSEVSLEKYANPPIDNALLVAAYSFDEGTGNKLYDKTNNHNDGTITNATWTTGKYGSALKFEQFDTYVRIEDSTSIELTGPMTLEAWVKPEQDIPTNPENHRVISRWTSANGSYLLGFLNKTPEVQIVTNTGFYKVRSSDEWTLDTWHHIAGTYNGTSLKIYVDGVLKGQNNSVSGTILRLTGHPTFIGALEWDTAPQYDFLNGTIDEIRIYKKALSQSEIQTDMNTAPQCTDTCVSKNYQCGQQSICGSMQDCGTCNETQSCNSQGQCINQNNCGNHICDSGEDSINCSQDCGNASVNAVPIVSAYGQTINFTITSTKIASSCLYIDVESVCKGICSGLTPCIISIPNSQFPAPLAIGNHTYWADVLPTGLTVITTAKKTITVVGTLCTDTCVSKNYQCGQQSICGSMQNCGTCNETQSCNSQGQCINNPPPLGCNQGTILTGTQCKQCNSLGTLYILNDSLCGTNQTCNSTGACIGGNLPKFSMGDHVRVVLTTDCLNVRPSPTISSTPIKCEPNGTSGITAIITGNNYVIEGKYTFWPLIYSDGKSGWSAEVSLEKI